MQEKNEKRSKLTSELIVTVLVFAFALPFAFAVAFFAGDPTRANWSVLPNLQQVPALLTPTSLPSRNAGPPESPDHAMASPSTQADKRRRYELSLSLPCDDAIDVGAEVASPLPLPSLASSARPFSETQRQRGSRCQGFLLVRLPKRRSDRCRSSQQGREG
jgi:hypothetical protein